MSRPSSLLAIVFLGLVVIPLSAQAQPGRGRGPGFGGGRGPGAGRGFGQGFGQTRGGNQQETNEKAAGNFEITHPEIADHGGVVHLPSAAQQPRRGTKLLVDLTGGGDATQLNSGLDKVAKYVNIYAGAGANPTPVSIAVVFHGAATLAVLKPEVYAQTFQTDGNPNLQLLEQLHHSGVEFYVCGQSLISKGFAPEDVVNEVQTAVSALTAVVNLQTDGYAYVPLGAQVAPAATEKIVVEQSQPTNATDQGHGPMMGRGRGPMPGMQSDMSTLHAMFADRDKIKRTVRNLPDGAEALTESDDEAIAKLLKEHVPAMESRVLGNEPLPPMTFHPIFVQLIKHADDYSLTYEETENGMKVRYQSEDPYVVMLVQEHAKLVSRFIQNGMEEIHKPYELPKVSKGN